MAVKIPRAVLMEGAGVNSQKPANCYSVSVTYHRFITPDLSSSWSNISSDSGNALQRLRPSASEGFDNFRDDVDDVDLKHG
ncbi:hypothetical protein PoB_004514500 [Plakobranchus ocellatus]|uniref:Uncharacterized protein n=1 Tax=Plakobranchus ocellatus TaxID=259542 RepID=A0AAV4BDK2_9GAST|nr:hypothetical protein PoB_004514500 [Plakobranchus ocellatus]